MTEETKTRALKLLEKRDLSRQMLLDKLTEKGIAEAEAQEVADWLCGLCVVDDRRYAGMVVRHYAARGYGRRRIEQELYRRGIGRPLWDQAMEELPAADDTVYALLCQKLRGTRALPPDIQRAQGFLLRRGYSWEEIRAALDHYRAQNEDDTRDE